MVDPDQGRLITHRQPVLVDRCVGGGDHVDHACGGAGCVGRYRQHPGVRLAREDDDGVECVVRDGITGVAGRAVDLVRRVTAGDRGSDRAHGASSTSTTLARCTACMIG